MSVFSSLPPNYLFDDEMLLIKVDYGIQDHAMALNSAIDQIFICNVVEYVLMISNKVEEISMLMMKNEDLKRWLNRLV